MDERKEDEEDDEEYDIDIDEEASEDEEGKDTIDFLRDLGVLDDDEAVRPTVQLTADDISEASKKADIRRLTKACMLVSKGHRMQSKGYEAITDVIRRNPSLADLAQLLRPFGSSSSLPSLSKREALPQVIEPGEVHIGPQRLGPKQFKCRMCSFVANSWSGCDSHTRQYHTKSAYGPCSVCGAKRWSADTFRKHQKRCLEKQQLQKASMHAGMKREEEVEGTEGGDESDNEDWEPPAKVLKFGKSPSCDR